MGFLSGFSKVGICIKIWPYSNHFGMCFVQMISVKNSTVVAARSFASLEVFGGTFRSWLWNRQWSGAAYLLHLWYKIQKQRLFSDFQYVWSQWGIFYNAIFSTQIQNSFFLRYFIKWIHYKQYIEIRSFKSCIFIMYHKCI